MKSLYIQIFLKRVFLELSNQKIDRQISSMALVEIRKLGIQL